MKTDFEKLKELCDANGFELVTESPDENDKFFLVKKKDIWEGVEFVKVAKIHKVYRIDGDKIYFANNTSETWALREKCTPSTKQAYIEQLKKEAFVRFGEIKEGDRFKFNNTEQICCIGFIEFDYYKHTDRVLAFGAIIYEKGKWAERVKEKVTVEFEEVTGSWDNYYLVCFDFTLNKKFDDLDKNGLLEKAGEYLKQHLENFLNENHEQKQ